MENVQIDLLIKTSEVLVARIDKLEQQVRSYQTVLNLLMARSDLSEGAIQDLFETHWSRDKLAERSRQHVAELLDARADHPNSEYEQYLTLSLAALLEAAGEPPPR